MWSLLMYWLAMGFISRGFWEFVEVCINNYGFTHSNCYYIYVLFIVLLIGFIFKLFLLLHYYMKRILLFLRAEWKWHLKKQKWLKNVGEKADRLPAPSCLFFCVVFVTKMWQWEGDRMHLRQVMHQDFILCWFKGAILCFKFYFFVKNN